MKPRNLFHNLAVAALVIIASASAYAQQPTSKPPRQEKLLNGLKLLMWTEPASDKVTLRLRIHSGSAFDPQGKEGVMKLLAENLFPNENTREFFREDLGGEITVSSNYDYIQIDASAKSDEFLTMIEAVATAVSNPAIDKETTAKMKSGLSAKVAELEKDTSYIADRAVAKRLFGTFPYGRPELGTTESIAKIDFADLLEARQRFLTADNATVAISGKFDPALAFRASRRYFGGWLKSDKAVPPTFKQPDEPDTKPMEIVLSENANPEVRFARRGWARNDKDYYASEILGVIIDSRFKSVMSESAGENFTATQYSHILPGFIVISYRSKASLPGKVFEWPVRITDEEFSRAKTSVLAAIDRRSIADRWLDVDTYKLASVADDIKAFQITTVFAVQSVADRFAKNPEVSVYVRGEKK